jgi:precorrin-2 dehydrogenase / sirohydrochlorin ferrochelatase
VPNPEYFDQLCLLLYARIVLYPVMLEVAGADVLVVGAGPVGASKAAGLAACGARVTVVAPEVADEARRHAAEVLERPFEPGDVRGRRLVVTATGVREVDDAVFAAATAAGIWVNSADDPERCTFILPAVLRRGPVIVSVSTSGASPALAKHLRDRVAEVVGPEVEAALILARRAARSAADRPRTTTGPPTAPTPSIEPGRADADLRRRGG